MKLISIIILVIFAGTEAFSLCDLPQKTVWLESSDSENRMRVEIPNDRNIYFKYQLGNSDIYIDISHKIYVCSGKNFYLVTEDDTVELFAYIDFIDEKRMKFHFAKKDEILGNIEFVRVLGPEKIK